MGNQLSFTEENVKKRPFDYPKVKLANGETARLTIVENPYSEYVHNIEKPVTDEKGKIIYVTKERRDGTEYKTPKLTWISNPICLGDVEVLKKDGSDPANCPACAAARDGDPERGSRRLFPKRRFAMHVIKSNTKPSSFDAVSPWGGQLLIWAFTDQVFNKLIEFQKEQGLAGNDLKLGPCTDPVMQKAELNIANGTVVSEDDRKSYFAKENQAEDPTVFCGRRTSKQNIEADLAQIDAVWAKANGDDQDESLVSSKSLSEGLDSLLTEDEVVKPTSEPEPASSVDDLLESKPAPKAEPKSDPKALDVDSLLDSIV